MNRGDTISVLMCVHSQDELHDKLFERALLSLDRQTYRNFQIVVILDDCHVSTLSVLSRFIKNTDIYTSYYIKPKKEGLAVAKNVGLKRCTGKWIMYLDADDQYVDSKVEVQVKWMMENPAVDFCFTQSWDRDENGKIRPNCFQTGQYTSHEDIVSRLPVENVLCHGSACIRKTAIDNLGGYSVDKKFLGMEDWHLWHRAVQSGYRFMNIPERLYIYSLGTSVDR